MAVAGRLTSRPAAAPRVFFGVAIVAIVALTLASRAAAHGPSTAIGRAVEALKKVSVSYEEGAAVSDIEAGNFPTIVGSNPKVAFMAAEAASEITGGPNALAEEIAREARLHGTLLVLVGRNLGWWSEDIDDERLAELAGEARVAGSGVPAPTMHDFVRSVQAESADATPWLWIVGAIALGAIVSFLAFAAFARRRAPASA